METLQEYLDKVKQLTGNKIKFQNPVTRADYELQSVLKGRWLSLPEYNMGLEARLATQYLNSK